METVENGYSGSALHYIRNAEIVSKIEKEIKDAYYIIMNLDEEGKNDFMLWSQINYEKGNYSTSFILEFLRQFKLH